jgi:hypothetical protein
VQRSGKKAPGVFPASSLPFQSFKFTYLLLEIFTAFIAYHPGANVVIKQVPHAASFPFDNIKYFISDCTQTSQQHPLKTHRMSDTEPKVEEDVLVGEEEGNDEVCHSVAFRPGHC